MTKLTPGFHKLISRRARALCALGVAWLSVFFAANQVLAQGQPATVYSAPTTWSEVYNPKALLSLNVKLSADEFAIIRADETFDIEVPAIFWLDNIDPNPGSWNISIRRKSATAIGDKVSYRIAFESKIGTGSSRWVNIKGLSLENGDDMDIVSEGLAWYLHRRAWSEDYKPGLAAWTTLTLHLVQADGTVVVRPQGVYVNVELPDKRFLENRGLWTKTSISWLYKQDDIGLPELKEWPVDSAGPAIDSPAYAALAYSPFQAAFLAQKAVQNPPPDDLQLEADLTYWINLKGMLRLGAVNAFTANPDELFNHAKNFFWADFGDASLNHAPRLYFPWDLDAAIRSPNASIYGTLSGGGKKLTLKQHPYQEIILNHPVFGPQYDAIMGELLSGAFDVNAVNSFLNDAEILLTPALLADPNNKIGNTPQAIADHFNNRRTWTALRHEDVRKQLQK
jgi:hypothetical protein